MDFTAFGRLNAAFDDPRGFFGASIDLRSSR